MQPKFSLVGLVLAMVPGALCMLGGAAWWAAPIAVMPGLMILWLPVRGERPVPTTKPPRAETTSGFSAGASTGPSTGATATGATATPGMETAAEVVAAAAAAVDAAVADGTPVAVVQNVAYDVSWDRDARVLNSLAESVVLVDEDGILEWNNEAASLLFGLESEGAGLIDFVRHLRKDVPESADFAKALETGLEVIRSKAAQLSDEVIRATAVLVGDPNAGASDSAGTAANASAGAGASAGASAGAVGETAAHASAAAEHRIENVPLGQREFDLRFLHRPKGEGDILAGTAIVCTDTTLENQIDRLKDGILSCVSHELRTPLTNICATAEILRDMPPANVHEAQDFLRIMTKESMHLAQVVDDIMDVSLLESDQAVLETTRVNVSSILRAAKGSAAEQAEDAGVDVQVDLECEDLFCLADRRRLRQVVDKLLDNAIKFTPAGGSIRIAARNVAAGQLGDTGDRGSSGAAGRDQDMVQITVDDSGFGIPKEHRESVFEKFQQHRDTLTDKPAGTGLGLSICHMVVTRLGGSIWCEESDLGGARLSFVLPATDLVGA